MALNVVLVAQKQSSKGIFLSWNAMEGVASYLVFVATRKLTAEELEAAVLLGGTDDCAVIKLGADVTGIVDDCSPDGEPRFYGVAMNFSDGAPRSARFKATPDAATPGAPTLSSKGMKKAKPAGAPAPAAAAPAPRPAGTAPTGNTGSYRVAGAAPAAAPAAASAPASAAAMANAGGYRIAPAAASPSGNTGQARVAAPAASPAPASTGNTGAYKINNPPPTIPSPARPVAEAQPKSPAPKPAAPKAEPKSEASAPASELDSLSNTAFYRVANAEAPIEVVAPPREFPLAESLSFRMTGGTQTWDGLRLYWERDFDAAAYEIIVADHQLFSDELGDVIAGRSDFTSCTSCGPSTMCVIDNITPRDARGWYLILARDKKGGRKVHPFQLGDAAQSGKAVAQFANPNRTGELRGEVEEMLDEAREQLGRWKNEHDGGAKREAKRIADDALLIYPNHPGAKELANQLG